MHLPLFRYLFSLVNTAPYLPRHTSLRGDQGESLVSSVDTRTRVALTLPPPILLSLAPSPPSCSEMVTSGSTKVLAMYGQHETMCCEPIVDACTECGTIRFLRLVHQMRGV